MKSQPKRTHGSPKHTIGNDKKEPKSKKNVDISDVEFPTDSVELAEDRDVYHDDGTNRPFVDYDPKRDTRKYPVYRNDIKFKKERGVDPNRAIWADDVKHDFHNKETDSIEYRLEECKMEKYETLDLSHMTNDCFKKLFANEIFKKIKGKIHHLFAKDCNLDAVPNLTECRSLQTLDLSCNKLKELPELPETLEELIVNDNLIKRLENDLPNLKRLNINNNAVMSINYSNSLESIHMKNNPIEYIPLLGHLYFLDISTTKITKIHKYPQLKILDCSYTNISTIPCLDRLEQLLCNYSNVEDIGAVKDLHLLEMINTRVKKLHYMKSLQTVLYHHDDKFSLSNNYKLLQLKKNKNNIVEIFFFAN
jgi:hypothetical protein